MITSLECKTEAVTTIHAASLKFLIVRIEVDRYTWTNIPKGKIIIYDVIQPTKGTTLSKTASMKFLNKYRVLDLECS
ncbi:hypothetical protein Pfo_011708 [Paulownia fortunei]|nr:hypothetical protein Pfo_011708 [Paulownia fortunei]